MAARERIPATSAVRQLREARVPFRPHVYAYEERGGTAVSARELGVEEHRIAKTLVMEDETGRPLLVLMHGDREVSTKELARTLGVKSVSPCSPATAERHTGYRVGGTSPFGIRRSLPICMEASLAELPEIYLNGGRRGFLVSLDPREVVRLLRPTLVHAAIA